MYFSKASLVGALALGLLHAAPASAAAIDPAALMNEFAFISLGDADISGINHIEGRAYVGGNVNLGNGYANSDGEADVQVGAVSGSFIIGGNVTGTLQGGSGQVVVGGSLIGSNNIGSRLTTGVGTDPETGVPVDAMRIAFQGMSGLLADLDDTSGASISGDMNGRVISSGAGNEDGLAILNLTSEQVSLIFSGTNDLSFNIAENVTLVVNVMGETLATDLRINNQFPRALFNFYEATTLAWGSSTVNTSALAPYAELTSSPGGGTRGSWVVGSMSQMNGEIRSFQPGTDVFTGDLSSVSSVVPLPAGAWLMLGGIGALGGLRLRRRKG